MRGKTGSYEEDAATCEDATLLSITPIHVDDDGRSFCSRGGGLSTKGTREKIGELRQEPSGEEPPKPTLSASQEGTKRTRTRLADTLEPMDLLLGRTRPLRRVGGCRGRSLLKGGDLRVILGT